MVNCVKCSAAVSRTKPAISCDVCKSQYHSVCVSKSMDIIPILSQIPGLTWKCEQCRESSVTLNGKTISDFIESKLDESFVQLKQKVDSIKVELLNRSACVTPAVVNDPPRYADIVKNKTLPAVIVQPKNQQAITKTREDIMSRVNPADSDLQLSRVRTIKDGGLLIGCSSKADNSKLVSLLQENLPTDYVVKQVNGISPRIRVVGLSASYSDEYITKYLAKCNSGLFLDNSECSVLKTIPLKNKPEQFQSIVQVDKTSYERVLKAGHVLVGLDSCVVYDAVEVFRCFKCNDYNHSSSKCVNQISCPLCGDAHNVKDCKSTVKKCINCCKHNAQGGPNVPTNHAVWDRNSCSVYKSALDRLKSDLLQ